MLRRPDHVRTAAIGHGTTAVLNLRTGKWVWMDEDTRRIWEAALTAGSSIRILIDTIAARGHNPMQVQEAVAATMATLHDHGLLTEHRATPRRRTLRQVITCR
ncbi:hypothetical protein OG285_05990 [Streptomyces sp. NBC_01471]|uniref:PqqD family protein n=1 Tax=Streptomyces sp. NBC_01471 TaxID=2903879 RepID=UPI0032514C98